MLDFSKTQYWLAPLAGWTDLPFRETVKKFGADLTVSEMVSSNALVYNPNRTVKLFEKSPLEDPYSVQINGSTIDIVKRAVEILNTFEGIDIIDLNSGCPAPKIVRSGSGSALLRDLPLLNNILKTIKDTSNKKMTSVKIRLGFDEKIGVDAARACEDAGVDFLVVHGRTKTGGYTSEVDYTAIKEIKKALSIPVIANGDITSYEIANEVLDYTGADGVMIGRGAMGKPWIFQQLKDGITDPSSDLKKDVVLEHYDNMVRFHGEKGVIMFRKHIHRYSKGYRDATDFREKVNHMEDVKEVRELLEEFFTID